ncbi:DUF6171 family protein [Paenibacillus filicis]|uniref:DUF6171 family protein n=1 Tax=Paenibacillus gyeongsangnamensis TaxID=3388067 RepID=A0ABT4Q4T6_9BACL|nr:DUF6171 family protein [Paenibacillus filicis]MCZ8511846.1 DUF6171 family protein [Paenibacillus filicis]
MSGVNRCKGCDDRYRITPDRVERLMAAFRPEPDACVTEQVYELRLQSCASCPRLSDGTSCSVCGCIVQIRARLKAKECPHPNGSRWSESNQSPRQVPDGDFDCFREDPDIKLFIFA